MIYEYINNKCRVILNNSKRLNALDEEMIMSLKNEVESWKFKGFPEIVILSA